MEGAIGAAKTAADEAPEAEPTTEAKKPLAGKSGATRSAAKQKKAARRSKKRTPSARVSGESVDTTAQEAQMAGEHVAVEAEPAKPASAAKKRARRRRIAKTRRSKAATLEPTAAASPPSPRVKPISPSAEVEQREDTIVIRFPSATPPSGRTPAAPAAEQETGRSADRTGPGAGPDEVAPEPVVGPEVTEEAPTTADQPEETAEAKLSGEAAPARSKRRRRRRKKDPRLASEKGTPPDERREEEAERQRPEPAVEPTDITEPTAEEKPSRGRRRRARRSRKQEPASAASEPAVAAAAKPAVKPEPEAETPEMPAPSGQKEMIINVVPEEECRIAIMEEGKLQEIYLERASAENYVGNIYKGIVTNVEASIQAAFVDFGQGKNGFLHISDLHPQYFPNGEGHSESVGRKMPRRNRPPIQRCLRRGQQLLVQITKEGIGTKGPTLTTYLSIPGRFLVMMPGMRQVGVSRKIEDDEARQKLRSQLLELALPENIGFIARTAALDHTKRELQSDLGYLTRLWKAVEVRIKNEKAPIDIYTESDLVIRTIRDVYTPDITRIVVDNHEVAERAHEFLSVFSPRSHDTVVEYDDPEPIFHRYGIEAELERLHSRQVPLKSGGSLVIDQTEALVAVDVNSGRFRTEDDAETTAYKINLEAADEIPRQLRLRDLGGVVICDFIDMRQEKHKREIERRLNRNLKQHKERAKLLRMSAFGIIELTRQRQRASLTRSVYQDCRHCHGTGLVKTAESVVLDVMRLIQLAVTRENLRSIEVSVSPDVAHLLQNRKRAALHELEAKNGRSISIRTDPSFGLDQIQVQSYDVRGRVVPHT